LLNTMVRGRVVGPRPAAARDNWLLRPQEYDRALFKTVTKLAICPVNSFRGERPLCTDQLGRRFCADRPRPERARRPEQAGVAAARANSRSGVAGVRRTPSAGTRGSDERGNRRLRKNWPALLACESTPSLGRLPGFARHTRSARGSRPTQQTDGSLVTSPWSKPDSNLYGAFPVK
jgi:hypothetical protein